MGRFQVGACAIGMALRALGSKGVWKAPLLQGLEGSVGRE